MWKILYNNVKLSLVFLKCFMLDFWWKVGGNQILCKASGKSILIIDNQQLTHSQLFRHTSKSCVVNFAFFAWNPFNLPRVVGWYHWNPQNRPKGALFRGDKKSSKILFKSVKILNWPWRAHFWAHSHLYTISETSELVLKDV